MAVRSIYKLASSTIYIYTQEVKILGVIFGASYGHLLYAFSLTQLGFVKIRQWTPMLLPPSPKYSTTQIRQVL